MIKVHIVKGKGIENYGIIFGVWTSLKKAEAHLASLQQSGHKAKIESRVTYK